MSGNSSRTDTRRPGRDARLKQALRDNLRRRKAVKADEGESGAYLRREAPLAPQRREKPDRETPTGGK